METVLKGTMTHTADTITYKAKGQEAQIWPNNDAGLQAAWDATRETRIEVAEKRLAPLQQSMDKARAKGGSISQGRGGSAPDYGTHAAQPMDARGGYNLQQPRLKITPGRGQAGPAYGMAAEQSKQASRESRLGARLRQMVRSLPSPKISGQKTSMLQSLSTMCWQCAARVKAMRSSGPSK